MKEVFEGAEKITPKGGVLRVISVEKYGVCLCTCSICSEDKELFPEGFFKVSRYRLIKGSIPCGCTRIKWSESQYKVRVERRCHETGYISEGFVGDFKGHTTKLKLFNPATGNSWDTTSLHQYINAKTVDPVEGKYLNKIGTQKEDEYHITNFMKTGSFLVNTIFGRSDKKDKSGRNPYWCYKCPVCSYDEYVEEGYCSGIFTGNQSHLKNGKLSCRCAKSYRWSREQRESKIKKELLKIDSSFIEWVGDYKGESTKFKWSCSKNHQCKISVGKFVSGQRCKTCADLSLSFGYYKDREKEEDHLYIYEIVNLPYIKIGRTFTPDTRIKDNYLRISRYYGEDFKLEIKQTLFTSDHLSVYNKEQYLLGNTPNSPFSKYKVSLENGYGSSELLYKEVLPLVIENLNNDINFRYINKIQYPDKSS